MESGFSRGYSRLQIILHWLVVAAILSQWATSGAIHRTHDPLLPPARIDLVMHALHNYVGMAIGAMVVLRIGLRLLRPATPAVPGRRGLAASLVHWGIYASLLAQAATGFVTSYFWGPLGALHALLWNVTLALVALHLAANAWHAMRGDGVVARMFRPA